MSRTKTSRPNVRVSPEEKADIRRKAKTYGPSLTALICDAVKAHEGIWDSEDVPNDAKVLIAIDCAAWMGTVVNLVKGSDDSDRHAEVLGELKTLSERMQDNETQATSSEDVAKRLEDLRSSVNRLQPSADKTLNAVTKRSDGLFPTNVIASMPEDESDYEDEEGTFDWPPVEPT